MSESNLSFHSDPEDKSFRKEKIKKSLMLTGAPTTGKTTILKEMLNRGLVPAPDETTRQPRENESPGIDKLFVTVDEFIRRFELGWYLEPNIEFTKYHGNHYGSPRSWLEKAKKDNERIAFVTVSTEIARNIKLYLSGEILWVHLETNLKTRAERLRARGISETEIEYRLKGGDSHLPVDDSDLLFDTSEFSLEECLQIITAKLYEK